MTDKLRNLFSDRRTIIGLRVFVGAFFVFTGFLKATAPWQEFATIISYYKVLPAEAIPPFAMVVPWLEIFFGLFLMAGILPILSIYSIAAMLILFTVVTAYDLIIGVDLSECGCFGGLNIPDSPQITIVRNPIMLLMLWPVYRYYKSDPRSGDLDYEAIEDGIDHLGEEL